MKYRSTFLDVTFFPYDFIFGTILGMNTLVTCTIRTPFWLLGSVLDKCPASTPRSAAVFRDLRPVLLGRNVVKFGVMRIGQVWGLLVALGLWCFSASWIVFYIFFCLLSTIIVDAYLCFLSLFFFLAKLFSSLIFSILYNMEPQENKVIFFSVRRSRVRP